MIVKPNRISNFDYLRFFCAAIIALQHFQQVFQVTFESGINWYGGEINFGYLVEVFFMLSGYLSSTRNYGTSSFTKNITRRWLRIFPYAFTASLLCCVIYFFYRFLLKTNFIFGFFFSVTNQIASLLLIHQGWFYEFSMGINNPTWYLCVLVWIDILYFGFLSFTKRIIDEKKQNTVICAFSIILLFLGLLGRKFKFALPFLYYSDCRGYSAFFLGVIVGIIDSCWNNKNAKIILSLLSLIISTVIIFYIDSVSQGFVWLFLLGPGLVILLANIKQFQTPLGHILGAASFEVYLWHVPAYYFLKLIYDLNNLLIRRTYLNMYIVLIVIEIYGILFYCVFEKALQNFINERLLSWR